MPIMGKEGKNIVITEEVVRYVANLSRLSLNEEEVAQFKGQLSSILEYIDQLDEVDVSDTLPTTHVLPTMKNVFREDELKPSLSPSEALQNAPLQKDNFFNVPKVIKDS